MKILVTGGAGYIGSHTCVELLNAGHELVIVDNFCNSRPEALESIRKITGRDFAFIQGDLRDAHVLDAAFSGDPADAVIHFAGLKAVGESVAKPIEYYDNNLTGTMELLKAMRRHGVKRIVFSSSATVYGMNNPVPFREGMPTSATNPYGWTKVMIEQILADTAHAAPDMSVCLLRYFNPVGAHESGLIGEDPNGIPNNLVPYVSQVAAGLLTRLRVFGDDYDTPDGTGVRDYIHVVDLARGHLAALDYTMEHTGCEVFNLGTGKGTSVLEIVKAYEAACGREIPYEVVARRPGDIASAYANTEKAARVLGWKAQYGVQKMCEDAWRFARQRYGV